MRDDAVARQAWTGASTMTDERYAVVQRDGMWFGVELADNDVTAFEGEERATAWFSMQTFVAKVKALLPQDHYAVPNWAYDRESAEIADGRGAVLGYVGIEWSGRAILAEHYIGDDGDSENTEFPPDSLADAIAYVLSK